MDRETLYKFFEGAASMKKKSGFGNGWNIPRKTDANS